MILNVYTFIGIYLDRPQISDDQSKCTAINLLVEVWKMILWLERSPVNSLDSEIISTPYCESDI